MKNILNNKIFLWLAISCVLLVLTMNCIYGDFFTIDDESLISIPQLRAPMCFTLLKTIFTPGNHIDYYPIRDFSYWFDIHLFGADTTGVEAVVYRVHNILLLATSAVLLATILELLGAITLAIPVSLLWVFHPVHFETMIWASARKDILAITYALAAFASFLKSQQTNKKLWSVLSILFFVLSLLSKASFSLLPLLGWVAFCFYPKFRTQKNTITLAILTSFGLASSLFQSWFYSNVNDMRFFYTFDYRIKSSLAALGKMAAGWINPSLNIIDGENWGGWLDYNLQWVPVGIALWLILIGILIYAYKRKTLAPAVLLLGFLFLYLPTAALIFPHRNFYSVRYFEAPMIVFFIGATFFVQKYNQTNLRRIFHVLIIVVFSLSVNESKNWNDSVKIVEKSLKNEPNNPSLSVFKYCELRTQKRWGKLNAAGIEALEKMPLELEAVCEKDFKIKNKNGSLCINYWVVAPEFKHFLELSSTYDYRGKKFYAWDNYLTYVKSLNPVHWQRQHDSLELKWELIKENSSLANQQILAAKWLLNHPQQPDSAARTTYWYSTCLLNQPKAAKLYLEEKIREKLIDESLFLYSSNRLNYLNLSKLRSNPDFLGCGLEHITSLLKNTLSN